MGDARAMYENWASDDKSTKYLSWDTHKSIETTNEVLAKWIPEYDKLDYYHWGFEYIGHVIGAAHFHNLSEKDEKCEIGYCLGSKWWNKGIMTEAVAEIFRFAFEEVNLYKIYAMYDTENIGSGRVMQKSSMQREGYMREHTKRKDGTRGDMAYYAILKREWKKIKEENDHA